MDVIQIWAPFMDVIVTSEKTIFMCKQSYVAVVMVVA